ncbi:MAG: hypothetical protein QOI21_5417 [Actinomycetota bacterium]|jgi:hypothetical protein|nr:hypothetical protein [Actinomycetota bacterium]
MVIYVIMRRLLYASTIALLASVGLASSALAATPTASFKFSYVNGYGKSGLSQPYAGPSTTGQSYGTGVAINPSDPRQKVYSLVEATANVGVGGPRGAFPASSRTVPPSAANPSYLGPYYIVRRTSKGEIDTSFGADGYVSAFKTSADTSYKFTSMCLDPGTGNIVIVGQQSTSAGPVGFVERLTPPVSGDGTATLDTGFNPTGATPGIVTIATPNGNNSPTLYGCSVVDEGAGHSGAILVGGVDDAASTSLVLAAKISSSGGFDTLFGTNGVVEYPVDSVDGSGTAAEITNVSLSGAHSDFPDVILSGFSFAKGTKDGPAAKATALTVAVKDRTGALDTAFNGTGELIDPQYGEAVLGRVASTHAGNEGGAATDLYIVYGTAGSYASAYVDYPITGGVPDTTNPKTTATGTFTVPADFASMQGYTFNSRGQIVVSGDTGSNTETLTTIGGSRTLGY